MNLQAKNLQTKRVLVIGSVWPEPRSSAAGRRSLNVLDAFLRFGWQVSFLSPASKGEHAEDLNDRGIATYQVEPNKPLFDSLLREISPDVVVFDRFIMEEQFGWRVQETLPRCVRILDTQDLHFLRRSRQHSIEEGKPVQFLGDVTFRELGSIYRCDLTLVISDYEYQLLRETFGVPQQLLEIFRFAYPLPPPPLSYEEREAFIMIGNFRHAPNMDGLNWFTKEVWPKIKIRMPDARLDVFGAYPSKQAQDLAAGAKGLNIKGWTPDALATLSHYRVSLAPLRFGAGAKGKISDSWWAGTPTVSTAVGAEGMTAGQEFPGIVSSDPLGFAKAAVLIYTHPVMWREAQKRGQILVRQLYEEKTNLDRLMERVEQVRENCSIFRQKNVVGGILQFHQYRSTKYLSKWIELKNEKCDSESELS